MKTRSFFLFKEDYGFCFQVHPLKRKKILPLKAYLFLFSTLKRQRWLRITTKLKQHGGFSASTKTGAHSAAVVFSKGILVFETWAEALTPCWTEVWLAHTDQTNTKWKILYHLLLMKDAEKPCPGASWDWKTVVITLLGATTGAGAELPHPVVNKASSSSSFPLHTWQGQIVNGLVLSKPM